MAASSSGIPVSSAGLSRYVCPFSCFLAAAECQLGLLMTFLVLIRRSFQIDEELLRRQQEAYKVEGVDETEAVHPRDRKRKQNNGAVRGR